VIFARLPLIERKMRLKAIMPKVESRVRYVDHSVGSGKKFFWLACEHYVEGCGEVEFGGVDSGPHHYSPPLLI
jgi:hypothetical protein